MAFPVAQLLLWWGFAKDPFFLGPKVAQAAPFLVPRAFRGEDPIPVENPAEYVSNPESTLLQGQPFDFNRSPAKNKSGSIQQGMPRQRIIPSGDAPKSNPASGDVGNQKLQ